jgi:hypothetical protein
MSKTQVTIAKFITAQRLRMKRKATDSNPNMEIDRGASHWKCLIYIDEGEARRKFCTYFSKGSGHHGKPPALKEVLDCLASDAAMIENSKDFADFCAESGYELTDSKELRKALKTYKVCKRYARKLKEFLGPAAYEQLLYEVERE